MIEIPEAITLAQQATQVLANKTILFVTANHSPHKFAWYHGDPSEYQNRLYRKKIQSATVHGGLVEILVEDTRLVFGDGVSLRFLTEGEKRPGRHQLLIEFDDSTALAASVQMYGGLWCFREGEFDNPYYHIAKDKPSPQTREFNNNYFQELLDDKSRKKSAKGFLATEQRIPGLGNGVLQDILFNAKIHPKRKMATVVDSELELLFDSVKTTLGQMASQGGRDTENNLFGQPGGYATILSKITLNCPCPVCDGFISKEAYMGGSIYYCPACQQQ